MAFAKALAEAGLLPAAYRKAPANVLLAMQYGQALGLSLTQILGGIHVIEGKPSMSADLMQALVRRAGHRIRTQADNKTATCSIVRADDPEYATTVTYTLDDARAAGLLGKDVWKKYPRSMLLARAVSACCRQACADVLAGVSYTPDELDGPVDWVDAATASAAVAAAPAQDPPAEPAEPAAAAVAAPGKPARRRDDPAREREYDSFLAALQVAEERLDLTYLTQLANTDIAKEAPHLLDQARTVWQRVHEQLAAVAEQDEQDEADEASRQAAAQ